ncbi:MAG: hypothetical protein ACPGTQ_08130 [Colwellia sp.]
MHNIIKRLELIKNCISLDEEELIDLQVISLKKIQLNNEDTNINKEINKIVMYLENHEFSQAYSEIELFLANKSALINYIDPNIQALKLELKVLENKLQSQIEDKNNKTNKVDDFNREYHLQLGELLQKILSLREEILYLQTRGAKDHLDSLKIKYQSLKAKVRQRKSEILKQEDFLTNVDEFSDEYDVLLADIQKAKDRLNDDEIELEDIRKRIKKEQKEFEQDESQQEYKEAQQDKASFDQEYEEIISAPIYKLNADEIKELKKIYRAASKLCHPDIVAEEFKEQATDIMTAVNIAYKEKNLKELTQLLTKLQKGLAFTVASDSINNLELLKEKLDELKLKYKTVKNEILEINNSQTYQVIQDIEDWDVYFLSIKTELESNLSQLTDELNFLKGQQDNLNPKEPGNQTLFEEPPLSEEEPYPRQRSDDNYWDTEF